MIAAAKVMLDSGDIKAVHAIGIFDAAVIVFCFFCLFLGERYKDKSAEALAGVAAALAGFFSAFVPLLSLFLWPW